MAEYHHGRPAWNAILLRGKAAADRQTHAQHVEVFGRHHFASDEGRPLAGRENPANVRAARDAGQRIDTFLDVEVVSVRGGELGEVLADPGVNLNEPVGLADRSATKQDRVHHREKSGVEANSERQGGNSGGGKPWVVKQLTNAVLHVADCRDQHECCFQLRDTLFGRRSFDRRG